MTNNDDLLARLDHAAHSLNVHESVRQLAADALTALRASNRTIAELTDRKDVYFRQCELLGQDLRTAKDHDAEAVAQLRAAEADIRQLLAERNETAG